MYCQRRPDVYLLHPKSDHRCLVFGLRKRSRTQLYVLPSYRCDVPRPVFVGMSFDGHSRAILGLLIIEPRWKIFESPELWCWETCVSVLGNCINCEKVKILRVTGDLEKSGSGHLTGYELTVCESRRRYCCRHRGEDAGYSLGKMGTRAPGKSSSKLSILYLLVQPGLLWVRPIRKHRPVFFLFSFSENTRTNLENTSTLVSSY